MAREFNKVFIKSGTIQDVDPNYSDDKVEVLIKASTETIDKEGDKFLKSAWGNEEDVEYFKTKGWIDYNHLSEILKTKAVGDDPSAIAKSEMARLQAIIGYPDREKALYWEDGALYCNAILDKNNPYVRDMVSKMKAGYDRFEASVAGVAYKPTDETMSIHGQKVWDRARITHIAICPSTEAINPDTKVMLIKSTMRGLLMEEQEQPATPQNSFDPVRQFVLESKEYNEWVAKKFSESFQKGEITTDYESAMNFMSKFNIPKKEAVEAYKVLLMNDKKEVNQ